MATSSKWVNFGVDTLVRDILSMAQQDTTYGSGNCFLTAYQIAIEFSKRHPTIAQAIAPNTGGKGGGPYAVTTYLSRELARRIRDGELTGMEVCFLDANLAANLNFDGMEATTLGQGKTLTMFRLIKV